MKKYMIFLLLISCSQITRQDTAAQGVFLQNIRGTYMVTDSGVQTFQTLLPAWVFPSNRRIELRDRGSFVLGQIDFEFHFLETKQQRWGVYEFIFNRQRYFVGLRREGDFLYLSPDNLVLQNGDIGLVEGNGQIFAEIIR